MAWGLIAALLVGQLLSSVGGEILGRLVSNVVMMYVLLYTVFGMAVAWGVMEHFRVPVGFRAFLLFMVYVTPPFNWALTLAGLLDGWVDFRRLVRRRQG